MQVYIPHSGSTKWFSLGDYGTFLIHGMSVRLPRRDGLLQLERTGPFVPPVTFPDGNILVTDATRQLLEARVHALAFRPVIVARCVELDWSDWDLRADDPAIYPVSNDPADYILLPAHDAALAERIGPLWELAAEIVPGIQNRRRKFQPQAYGGQALVRGSLSAGTVFASTELCEALNEIAPDWVKFKIVR
jgi:hypothetical protein